MLFRPKGETIGVIFKKYPGRGKSIFLKHWAVPKKISTENVMFLDHCQAAETKLSGTRWAELLSLYSG